jgi:hypothetical protein
MLHSTGQALLSICQGVSCPTRSFLKAEVALFESVSIVRKVFCGVAAVVIIIAPVEILGCCQGLLEERSDMSWCQCLC